jgi:gamma-glutamyltranspeptidase/glutathione hydrolase
MWRSTLSLLVLLSLQSLSACRSGLDYQARKEAVGREIAVVSPHPLASQAGLDVLRRGGNAVDAAAAMQLVMAVVYPRAGNIGGGGFMVWRGANGALAALDYREKAPLGAGRDMYLDSLGGVIDGLSREGRLAAGVPGTVAGLFAAYERLGGGLPFDALVSPAIALAEKGFLLSAAEAGRLNRYQEEFRRNNPGPNAFVRDKPWKEGDRLVQRDLAHTLRLIQQHGRAGFYEGETADRILAEMRRGGGLLTHEDLRRYQAVWRQPVSGYYKGLKVISMPPPSSGGVALLQMLEMIEPYPLAQWGFHSAASLHLMAEASRRAFADRAEYLGDPDFHPVPVEKLLDSLYLLERMRDFALERVSPSDSVLAGRFVGKESFETEHIAAVDAQGNVAAVTTTLNSNFGCKVIVDGAGFFLNNEMDDFSAKPGVPNQFGLVGAEANAIAPEKRMLSSMTPTIVEKDGRFFMCLGAPGGSTIITAVFQVFVNIVEFGMGPRQAIEAGRFHHQWLPDEIWVERSGLPDTSLAALRDKGHSLRQVERMAVVKVILRDEAGWLRAAADGRNPDDDARGQ